MPGHNLAKDATPTGPFDQQRDTLVHGLDLSSSGERLGLDFLLDGSQRINKMPNGINQLGISSGPTRMDFGMYLGSSTSNLPDLVLDYTDKRSPSQTRSNSGNNLPGMDGYSQSIQAGLMVAHSAPVRNTPSTCPLDSLLLDFLHERQHQAAKGVSSNKLVGPAYPSVASLLNPEQSIYSHPLSKVFTDILSTFPDLATLPEQISVLYIMFLIMRVSEAGLGVGVELIDQWQISPTLENYDRLPDWVTPRPSQLFTAHPAWVDHLPW